MLMFFIFYLSVCRKWLLSMQKMVVSMQKWWNYMKTNHVVVALDEELARYSAYEIVICLDD